MMSDPKLLAGICPIAWWLWSLTRAWQSLNLLSAAASTLLSQIGENHLRAANKGRLTEPVT